MGDEGDAGRWEVRQSHRGRVMVPWTRSGAESVKILPERHPSRIGLRSLIYPNSRLLSQGLGKEQTVF